MWLGVKTLRFWEKDSPNCYFMVLLTFCFSNDVTGGSGVRGKMDPNWVRNFLDYSIFIV
jgi:hypothetical protein